MGLELLDDSEHGGQDECGSVMIVVLLFIVLFCLEASAQTVGWTQLVDLKVNDIRRTEFVSMAASSGGEVLAIWQSNNGSPYTLRAHVFFQIKDAQSWSSPMASSRIQTKPHRPIYIDVMWFSGLYPCAETVSGVAKMACL